MLARFSGYNSSVFSSHLDYHHYDTSYDFSDAPTADYVIHAASNASPDLFASDPFGTCLSNTSGTINSLNYAARCKSRNYLYFSTTGVYGINSTESYPLAEDSYGSIDPLDKKNIYLLSKKTAECLVVNASKLYNLNFNIVRPSIVYGPGLSLSDVRSFPYFLNCLLHNNDIILNSSGQTFRNYLYISDFIAAIFDLLAAPHNLSFNVASSVDTKILDLAMAFSQLSPNAIQVRFTNSSSSPDRVEFSRTTTSQLRLNSLYGWNEKVSLDFGIKKSIQHYSSIGSYN